jgi:hypothetical protein
MVRDSFQCKRFRDRSEDFLSKYAIIQVTAFASHHWKQAMNPLLVQRI